MYAVYVLTYCLGRKCCYFLPSLLRSQLSAPLTLSITKLKRRDRDRHAAAEREAPDGTVTSLTSFQEDVQQFPGGDSMLDSLMAMQSLHEQLNQQLEVHTCTC